MQRTPEGQFAGMQLATWAASTLTAMGLDNIVYVMYLDIAEFEIEESIN